MKILVTGGLGYIGSHTVVALQEAGFTVAIIDNLSNTTIEVLDRIQDITGIKPQFDELELRDKKAVQIYFQDNKDISGVIHFAASKAVNESVEDPLLYYENNLHTLVYLLQECRIHDINNVIFSSSCTVYGEPDSLPINEDAPIKKATSPYGNTKQINEEILQDVCAISAINTISLRYFNPIGAHASAKIGELPRGIPQNLVPYITQTAIGIREELSVFGNDYLTKDGSCIRDYIHVVDLANAHVVSLKRLLNKNNKSQFEVFNIGTGTGTSVFEIIKIFEKVSEINLNYKVVSRREGDVISVYADTTKANTILGWKAQFSIEECLSSAWKWEQTFRNK